jgi:EmrB/QacA subfamily drug resistance transporter
MATPRVVLRSPTGRWVLAATVLGSGMAMLDATVVNIALPAIGRDLDAGLQGLQWVVNAYTLTLAGFLLLGGALGDRFGRRRVFLTGVAWFATASVLCAVAPSVGALVAARALQGAGAALLTPGSLAILEAGFVPEDRGAAIGAWSGLGGVMTALGPFVGGWLVQAASWRWIFLINVPFAIAVIVIGARHVPETRNEDAPRGIDVAGALLTAGGLGGIVYGLTAGADQGWADPGVLGALVVGVACLAAFVAVEARSAHPLLPLALFRVRQFGAANLVTFVVYGALTGALFLVPIQLQTVLGYSPLASGAALLPITVIMLTFSARSGRLASRIGPRLQMGLGPCIAGAGLALLSTADASSTSYAASVLPGVAVFGAGLAVTVAPLTATALGAAGEAHAGVASAVNNDVARSAGLVAVAVLPALAGITSADFGDAAAFSDGFRAAMLIAAATMVAGGMLAWLTVRNPAPGPTPAVEPTSHCALDAPPLRIECAPEPAG